MDKRTLHVGQPHGRHLEGRVRGELSLAAVKLGIFVSDTNDLIEQWKERL